MEPIIPTIGRIVLHRGADDQIRPAIVTHVWGVHCLNLQVFPKDSSDKVAGTHTSVTHADPAEEPGCKPSWHWMPYQKQQAAAGTSVHATPAPAKPNTITKTAVDDLIASGKITQTKVGEKTAVVMLTLPNGFEIIDSAACVDPKNFDEGLGRKYALEKVARRLWELEGYRLQCELAKV
jgi:hypothetical protein